MQVLSVTGVPNRFVLIPEKASFMQLIGLSDPGIIQGIESAIGLADKGMQMLPDIMQTDSLNDIKDLKINMKTMTDGLRSIEESLSQLKSDELVGYDIKNEDDWVRIFESKSPEKMGVQVARDQYGKAAWLCEVHAKEMSEMKPISKPLPNQSKFQIIRND